MYLSHNRTFRTFSIFRRTRIMSPASCQLLHPAIYNCDNLTVDLLSIQQYVKNVNGFYKNFDI